MSKEAENKHTLSVRLDNAELQIMKLKKWIKETEFYPDAYHLSIDMAITHLKLAKDTVDEIEPNEI
jgi:pyrroloquinoline quinone (PQQ) biosynthesis protein C